MKPRFIGNTFSIRRFLLPLSFAAPVLAVAAAVWAQTPSPGQRGTLFPRVHADAQNTGRALNEFFLGVTDGNRVFSDVPRNRTGTFDVDGWGFPRTPIDPATNTFAFTQRPFIYLDNRLGRQNNEEGAGSGSGTVTAGAGWTEVTGPGTGFQGVDYHRIRALRRVEATDRLESFFTWSGDVPGPAGAITRYAISVFIPGPPIAGASDPNAASLEQRIPDAEYTVTYNPTPTTTDTRTVRVSQQAQGWQPLLDEDGSVLFFPFARGGQARVQLSRRADGNVTETTYVVADAIRFVQQFDTVRATPTLTNRHGGRLVTGGAQPAAIDDSGTPTYTAADFAPDSTLFQGPFSYAAPNATGANLPTNNQLYPAPIFSHMQVLVARTEFVPDLRRDSRGRLMNPTGSIEVGVVYSLDWLTGAPIWRFPDRSYLPPRRDANGNIIAPGGPRNPNGAIPGIGSVDRDVNGTITDDEVYIVGNGVNGSGGLSSSVTFVPNVPVLGTATLPDGTNRVYGDLTTPTPELRAVAYVGAANGVVYAFDAYGNNDSRYASPPATAPAAELGTFTPGTTNLLWTFNQVSARRGQNETVVAYNLRQKGEVPETRSFGTSAPTVAFNRPGTATDPTNPLVDEQRLFIGNENNVLYAMNAAANAGSAGRFPLRKDPSWWFETRGRIASTPAVSQSQLDAAPSPPPVGYVPTPRRGVYITTTEGRVYCIDWEGPVTKGDHVAFLNYTGTPQSANALNDAFRFRNLQPVTPTGNPDNTDGTVRPRWAFPNRYVDVNAADNTFQQPPDTVTGGQLAPPDNLGEIFSSVSLMEFTARVTDPATGTVSLQPRQYVVLSANDRAEGASTAGRVYLLNAAGDRTSFLSNPTAVGPTGNQRVRSHPEDRFNVGAPVGSATPAWTYRFQYGADPTTGNISARDYSAPTAGVEPSRRRVPTVFVGGVGRLYAIDLDQNTTVFTRWPADVNDFPGPRPDPADGETFTVPPNETDEADPLVPNPSVPDALLRRPILARTMDIPGDGSRVDGNIVITGGPLQVRGPSPTRPTNDPSGLVNNPDDRAVNQDIRDPLTRPTGTSFQYPALYVTTSGGFLHEISSNIEGEDLSTTDEAAFRNESANLGWALTTDPERKNNRHVLLDSFEGPGGTSGVALATNAYYPGLDPANPTAADATPPLRPRPLAANDTDTGQTGFPLDAQGLFFDPDAPAGSPSRGGRIQLPTEGGADNDPAIAGDTNPFGTNSVWVFAGGSDGLVYAITPVPFGGSSGGFPGGRFTPPGEATTRTGNNPRYDIFTEEDFRDLLRDVQADNPRRPNRDGTSGASTGPRSAAAQGRPNYYEWGESVYIVVWDLNAATREDAQANSNIPQYDRGGNSVNIRITTLAGTPVASENVPLQRQAGAPITARPVDYEYNPLFELQRDPALEPGATPPAAVPLGFAFYELKIGRGNQAYTPGSVLRVTVTQQTVPNTTAGGARIGGARRTLTRTPTGGPLSRLITDNLQPTFAIANPIGVQGLFTDTQGLPANALPPSVGDLTNAIGPFFNSNARKEETAAWKGTANDPNEAGYQYDLALANGNTIVRRDIRPYLAIPASGPPQRNPRASLPVVNDPAFYMPVAAGAGFTGHGTTGSTDQGTNLRNLRVLNRSRLESLGNVRIARADVLWRYWPGTLPNADVVPGLNRRQHPTGTMREDGAINYLPWEQAPGEAQPWKRAGVDIGQNGPVVPGANLSQDYPDIPFASVSATAAGGTPTAGSTSLPNPGSQDFAGLLYGDNAPRLTVGPNVAMTVNLRVPIHQPANLVSIDNLTSTYVAPNQASDGPAATTTTQPGPIQLPRGVDSRRLTTFDPQTGRQTQTRTIVPFGYTVRLVVYVDSNGNGVWDTGSAANANTILSGNNSQLGTPGPIEEAFRVFEVWVGVPVDMRLRTLESVVDVGAVAHGFGMQNGLLGYGAGTDPLNLGFAPPFTRDAPGPYNQFFKNVTVQNDGNVNLWNLRAAQRAIVYENQGGQPTPKERFLTLRSDTVNSDFGIASGGKDPRVAPNGLIPHIVTPLDRPYDALWNTRTTGINPIYGEFGGRHTLHKPRAGVTSPTVLGLPDVPANVPLTTVRPADATVGVSVPIGTPAGDYSGPLVFFEDYDTPLPNAPAGAADEYRPAPVLNGTAITPAGPMYGGTNLTHPGNRRTIRPENLEGVLRPQRITRQTDANGNNILTPEFLPATRPSPALKVKVTENALTGQRPDTAGSTPPSIITGLLPSVDPFPLLDPNDTARQAAALSPAAFRSALTGRLHTYFSRNITEGVVTTRPGSAFSLFRSSLNWDNALGTWVAANPGQPVADINQNQGRWFSVPQPITAGLNSSSNVSPYVLHEVLRNQNGIASSEAATLFWLNSVNTVGGAAVTTIWYAGLDADGVPGTPQPYLPNADPTIRRYAPKAVTMGGAGAGVDSRNTLIAFYYGGVPGRWSLLYSASPHNNGRPTGQPGRETALNIPAALSSASEPSAVAHYLPTNQPGVSDWALDVFYTGISRANQNAEIYMTRFRARGAGAGARLEPARLPRIEGERLAGGARDPVWAGAHIAWERGLGGNERVLLPEIFIQPGGRGNSVPIRNNTRPQGQATSQQLAWQYDNATGLLYQSFERTINGRRTLNVVYVDPSAGTVRFRGEGTPTSSDIITADYTPLTHRITQDPLTTDIGASTFVDRTTLRPTTNANVRNTVLSRPNENAFPVDRDWIVWQKGAQPGRPSTLFYTTRRVGVDLKAIPNGLRTNESIQLRRDSSQNNTGNYSVQVNVTLNGAFIPYEVDFERGRIYFPRQFNGTTLEGQAFGPGEALRIQLAAVELDDNGRIVPPPAGLTNPRNIDTGNANDNLRGTLNVISEQAAAQMIPMQRSVNEGQAQAFLDTFDWNSLVGQNQQRPLDPTLAPNRVWLFWSSPRGRAYDVYWQTIAPNFESRSFSGVPSAP